MVKIMFPYRKYGYFLIMFKNIVIKVLKNEFFHLKLF